MMEWQEKSLHNCVLQLRGLFVYKRKKRWLKVFIFNFVSAFNAFNIRFQNVKVIYKTGTSDCNKTLCKLNEQSIPKKIQYIPLCVEKKRIYGMINY